jgi:tRNA-splicing ligase RtcB
MVGIEYKDSDAFIDEIPAAYKDIDQVMADAQADRQREGGLRV